MPYRPDAMPDRVSDHLPESVRQAYRDAFLNACERGNRDEQRAHQIAWAALKAHYQACGNARH
ncbi:ChaB family protein [Chitiniphilus eburneus]|uniref:Cation transporter n=1 Tax=Chitiniphilus eburneus TaxID=2571148 RepID=A0A4U0PUD4_9NEIS|nr:ChaB family protein [Chitiniphilus eburneus]TJZ72025.1 cation transporter [Chitiniphilus eburneus]